VALVLLALPLVASAEEWRGLVVRVKDGDTFVVQRRGCLITVRLWGVDCPELRDKPRGPAAAELTRQLILGKRVRLVPHGPDKYGRTVAEVLLPRKQNLGAVLIRAGLGIWTPRYAPLGI
jgi:endonuclease YncB( thermonuclease family)